jgi:predicted small lipoprotein YifL
MVISMKRIIDLALALVATVALAACGNDDVSAPDAANPVSVAGSETAALESSKPGRDYDGTVRKPGSPFAMSYRIVGTPIVGSPVTIDLRVDSMLGSREVTMDYRINDLGALSLHEAQPDRVRIAPAENDRFILQRVTVVPQREGRIYLNVSASYETEEGSASAIMAVPIQVGAGGRELQENGEVQLDEDGEAVRVLSGD